jgi:excisionase family DNA binding protein
MGKDRMPRYHLISGNHKDPAIGSVTARQTEESDVAHGTSSAASPRFYSIKEVADFLGVSTRTIRRWRKSGELGDHRFGGVVRISHDDLQDFISRHERREQEHQRHDLSRGVRHLANVGKTPLK